MRRVSNGFTLLEVVFSIALLALLAALAFPVYQQTLHRALRQDARLALLRIQHRQERHFAEHLVYSPALTATRSDSGYYLLDLTTASDGNAWVAVARIDPAQRQAADLRCAFLSIDETGRRRSADASGSWHEDDPERCWG